MSLKVVDFTFQFQDLAEGPTGFLASSGQLLQSLQDALILAVFELMQQTTAKGETEPRTNLMTPQALVLEAAQADGSRIGRIRWVRVANASQSVLTPAVARNPRTQLPSAAG